jgi:hypothetical protein
MPREGKQARCHQAARKNRVTLRAAPGADHLKNRPIAPWSADFVFLCTNTCKSVYLIGIPLACTVSMQTVNSHKMGEES